MKNDFNLAFEANFGGRWRVPLTLWRLVYTTEKTNRQTVHVNYFDTEELARAEFAEQERATLNSLTEYNAVFIDKVFTDEGVKHDSQQDTAAES
jgi:uncharacterized protein YcbK (DUF882 family)